MCTTFFIVALSEPGTLREPGTNGFYFASSSSSPRLSFALTTIVLSYERNASAITFSSGFLVIKLTRGTIISPPTIATTPELMEDLKMYPKKGPKSATGSLASVTTIWKTAMPQPHMKHTAAEALVTFLE